MILLRVKNISDKKEETNKINLMINRLRKIKKKQKLMVIIINKR